MNLVRELREGGTITASGQGIIVCYDVPVMDVVEGRGQVPGFHLRVIRKLEGAGKVERLQNSVLLLKDPVALQFVVNALERVGARYLIIEGRITGTLHQGLRRDSARRGGVP